MHIIIIAHLNRGDIIRTELVFIIIGQSSFFWFLMHECSAVGDGVQQGCQASVSQSLLLSLTDYFYCFFLSTVVQQMASLLTGVQNTPEYKNTLGTTC